MSNHRTSRIVAAVATTLFAATAAFSLQPPTAEQIRQYKADGTFEARVKQARELGNHRVSPRLVGQTRERLRQLHAAAAGLPALDPKEEIVSAPPPAWDGGLPASGSPKVLVVCIDFQDFPAAADQTIADTQSKMFGTGDPARYPYESLRSYYQRASYNQLNLTGSVLGWFRALYGRSYYETAGRNVLIKEALNYYEAQGHDFTQYDNDGDGYIDAFFVKWTGPDNGWANFWWAYQTYWSDSSYRLDGKRLGKYVWSWIANPDYDGYTVYQPRVDIHESGHLLGLPDLYDYDNSIGPRGGVGGLDMMHSNWGDHNCYSKFMLGWLTPTTIISGTQTLSLLPSGTSQNCVLIMPGVTVGNMFDEFFMAQYRKRSTGNDPSNYPTDGLIIWHVDATLDGGGYDFLYDNSYTAHKFVRLMEADGLEQIEQGVSANAGDYYLPPKTFANNTTPNSRDYANAVTGVQVDQLTSAGTTMGGRFSVVNWPNIVAGAANMTSESCQPGNGVVDPQETVTISLALQNTGTGSTSNLVATLQATGGVTSPSAAQSYGVLVADGPAISRPFTFVASGTCGGTITATLQLQDGASTFDPVTFTFRLGVPATTLSQAFDSVTPPLLPAGWTSAAGYGSPPAWATSTGARDTLPNAAYASDPSTKTDNYLTSPSINVTTSTAQLSFRHSYGLEQSYDGGVLEISIAGGAFTDIVTAGGNWETGGYSGQSSTGNAFGARPCWNGTSNGFITTKANLPATAAGKTIQFRWRLGTDSSVGGSGWYVDTISLIDGATCCVPTMSIGDFNGDQDVDQEDFGKFQACFSGAGVDQNASECLMAHMEGGDTDVDNADLGKFLNCHTQAGDVANPNCRNLP